MIECVFFYVNFVSLDILEEFLGYVVGVMNLRFEELFMIWDVFCNFEIGKVMVLKNFKLVSVSLGLIGSD